MKKEYNCNHIDTIRDGINVICTICGEILNDDEKYVTDFPRVYNNEDETNKRFHEILDPFKSRKTTMKAEKGMTNYDTISRISKTDKWSDSGIERKSQQTRILIMNFLTNNKLLSKGVIKAADYYVLKTRKINLQGISLECYVSALLIYIFREYGIPFGVKKIMNYYNLKGSSVFKLVARLIKEFNLKNVPPLHLDAYVMYYINQLNNIYLFSGENLMALRNEALLNIAKITDSNMCGRNKLCDAAGIIYYSSRRIGLNITQDIISDILGVSSVSLRNTYTKIKNMNNVKNK